tara:strand:- start:21 stop:341 length:321 start_codon:yes stop_codon:yes gene_type:complete
MASPNYHNYTEVSGSTLEYTSSPAGNYNAAETWNGGESTGNWDAFLISGSSGAGAAAAITIAGANATTIRINNFEDQKLFEIGVTKVSGSEEGMAEVYLFKKGRRI